MMEFAFGYRQTEKGFIVHFGDKPELVEEGCTLASMPRPYDARMEALEEYGERGIKADKYAYVMFEHGYEIVGGTEDELLAIDGISEHLYDSLLEACCHADVRLQLDTYAEGKDSVFANELEKAWLDTDAECD